MSNINTELKVIQSASNADAYAVAILVSQGKTLIAAGPLAQGPLAGRVGVSCNKGIQYFETVTDYLHSL